MSNTFEHITVVVPAYNCLGVIESCVAHIENSLSEFPNSKIIVVDNGKNAGIENLWKKNNICLIKRHAINGAAYARNEGCKNANHGIIVFIDSDVLIEKNCIKNLVAPIFENKSHATIGNYSTDVAPLNFAQKYKQLYIHNIYAQRDTIVRNDFWTAISAIKADTFRRIGGFDTKFAGASGEDQELGIRLTRNNYIIQKVENAVGLHMHDYSILKLIKNDLKKGLSVLDNTLENKVPLSNNGHASRKNILAVLFSCIFLLTLLIHYVTPFIIIKTMVFGSLSSWLYLKSD